MRLCDLAKLFQSHTLRKRFRREQLVWFHELLTFKSLFTLNSVSTWNIKQHFSKRTLPSALPKSISQSTHTSEQEISSSRWAKTFHFESINGQPVPVRCGPSVWTKFWPVRRNPTNPPELETQPIPHRRRRRRRHRGWFCREPTKGLMV